MSNAGKPKVVVKSAVTTSTGQAQLLEKANPIVNHQVGGDFVKVDTSERRTVLLRATPHARQPSTLWTKDRRLLKKFFVRRHLEYTDQLEIEFADRAARVLGEVDKHLDLADNNEIFFNVRCEESYLFFHLRRRDISTRGGMLIVKIPPTLYEVQRRAQLRYRTIEGDTIGVRSEVKELWMEDVRILDVSSGGIGMIVRFASEDSAKRFTLAGGGQIHFHLDLGIFSFLAHGEVRYVRREHDPDSALPIARVGVRFVGLDEDTVEAIQLFVMERSYLRLLDIFSD